MANHRVFSSFLLSTGVLLLAACATQPASTPDSATSWSNTPLLEKKFQRAANNYEQYQFEGLTLYCQRTGTRSMPKHCLTEAALRKQVEIYERDRNPVTRNGPQIVATVPGSVGN